MKQCFKCLEIKPFSDFYKHPGMADGMLGKCKECTKKDAIEHRQSKLEHYRAYDRKRFQENLARRASTMVRAARFAKENPEAKAQAIKTQRGKHPEQQIARGATRSAIRKGLVVKATACEVCDSGINLQAHHHDYSQPTSVWWLCSSCHGAIHRLQRGALRIEH